MPNGVSCAYFAVRNHIYGKSENNMFKEGIAGCQTVRTCSAFTTTNPLNIPVAKPVSKFFSKAAAFARKIVYPLIIASGVYNTFVSDDKVKTGSMQAAGIGTMYAFECLAEKGLKNISSKLYNTNFVKNHKFAKFAVATIQGLAFVGASLGGYEIGSRGAESIVKSIRTKKNKKSVNFSQNNTTQDVSNKKFPIEDDLKKENIEKTLFEDMQL